MTRLWSFSTFCLIGFLTVQLTHLHPNLPWPVFSHGTPSLKQPFSERSFSPVRDQARFTTITSKPASLIFVGDVLLARNVETLMRLHGADYPYQGINFTTYAPKSYVIGNFEAVVPREHLPTKAGEMKFSVEETFLPALMQAGFTHLSLANNHSLDFGAVDFAHTVESLREAGLTPVGNQHQLDHDSVSFLPTDKGTIALIAVYGLGAGPADQAISEVFRYATHRSDLQIAYIHWGTEYQPINDAVQKELAEKLVAAGADLIVGHHPHVVENIDLIEGVPVFYSLGNYIFDQYDTKDTQNGLLLQIDWSEMPLVHLIPVTSIGSLSQPHEMSSQEHARFLKNLAEMSDSKLRPDILKGILPLNSLVASSTKIVMMNQ